MLDSTGGRMARPAIRSLPSCVIDSIGMPKKKHRWGGRIRVIIFLAIVAAVGLIAYTNRDELVQAADLIRTARLWWMIPAALAIGGVYVCRALVYGTALKALGYSFKWTFLWMTAIVATSLHQLLPAGGASGYAFLTYAFNQRGVSGGQSSLVALIDALSYAFAVGTLVIISLIYLGTLGMLKAARVTAVFAPGIVIFAVAVYVYYLQRQQRRFTRLVLNGRSASRTGYIAIGRMSRCAIFSSSTMKASTSSVSSAAAF